MKLTKRQRASIERNKREGLLCACNRAMVPYYDKHGREHGTLLVGNMLHGYDDCRKVFITAEELVTALERARVAPEEEIRVEFTGDDATPQELAAIDRRTDEDGNHYVCLVIRNT